MKFADANTRILGEQRRLGSEDQNPGISEVIHGENWTKRSLTRSTSDQHLEGGTRDTLYEMMGTESLVFLVTSQVQVLGFRGSSFQVPTFCIVQYNIREMKTKRR